MASAGIMQQGSLISCSSWNVSMEWSEEEQRTLEACLLRFPADRFDPLQRYVRIAAALPRKSVRDVALRTRWTILQLQLKKRTGVDPMRKPGMPPTAPNPPAMPLPGAPPLGGPSPAFTTPPGAAGLADGPPPIDGPIASLLDANLSILNHFKSNMTAFKVHENTQLLVQFRDNILQIVNAMEAMGGMMGQMPQLPIKLNVDLANNFLPSRPAGLLSYDGIMLPPPPQPAMNAPGMVPLSGFAPGGGTTNAPKPPMQRQPMQSMQAGPPQALPSMQQLPMGHPAQQQHHHQQQQHYHQQQQQQQHHHHQQQLAQGQPPGRAAAGQNFHAAAAAAAPQQQPAVKSEGGPEPMTS